MRLLILISALTLGFASCGVSENELVGTGCDLVPPKCGPVLVCNEVTHRCQMPDGGT